MAEGTRGGWKCCLKAGWQSGRLPCLNEADKTRLVELLLQGPESLGYAAQQRYHAFNASGWSTLSGDFARPTTHTGSEDLVDCAVESNSLADSIAVRWGL